MTGTVSSYFIGVKGGLIMSLIAFSIVFVVIVGLMYMMIAIKHIAAAMDRKNNNGGSGGKTVAVQVPAPLSPMVAAQDDGELLAVITAAVTAVCGSAARVVSFGPVIKAPASTSWKFVARMRNAEGLQD